MLQPPASQPNLLRERDGRRLEAVVAGCPNVQHLDIADCLWVPVGGLAKIVAGAHLSCASTL